MKHLKKFNESNYFMDLEKFCNDNLLYLIDIGFKVDIIERYNGFLNLTISKKSKNLSYHGKFEWSEVCDDFIPFFELLDEKYILKNLHEGLKDREGNIAKPVFLEIYCDDGDSATNNRTFTKEEVINNMIEESGRLSSKILKENKILFLEMQVLAWQ